MSERTWGEIEREIRDDYLRADGPENIQFRDVQWQVWRAEVERAAAARALEEFADQMTTGFNAGTLNAERRAIKREARVRAAEIRGGERHEVL